MTRSGSDSSWPKRSACSPPSRRSATCCTRARCYERQQEAIRTVFPDYGPDWKSKLTIPSLLDGDRLNVSRIVVEDPAGEVRSARLSAKAYLQMVAATNFKQRIRTMMEYYHADSLNYAVCGTPNRLEYDQGFFVKGGDGLADFKPIAHLYKTQVFALAAALGVPQEIRDRTPTTDTFSMPQTQEEFYFALPYPKMDLCLFAHNSGIHAEEVAPVVELRSSRSSVCLPTSTASDAARALSTLLRSWSVQFPRSAAPPIEREASSPQCAASRARSNSAAHRSTPHGSCSRR